MAPEKACRSSLRILFILSSALSVPWLGRYFFTRGEPREALVAQAMLATGNWISPPAYAGVVPSKPPFLHWLISLCSLPFGEVTEATSRLPSAIAVVLFSLCFYRFLVQRFPQKVAMLSSLVLLSCAEWFRASSSARVDTVLAVSFAGALLGLFSWEEGGRKGVPWVALVLCVCATLTKGPVGLVLPLSIFAIHRLAKSGGSWGAVPKIVLNCALLALPIVGVSALWYLAAYLERGDEFLTKVWYENFQRLSSSMEDEPHKHSAVWLLGSLFLGMLPWSLVLVPLSVSWLRATSGRVASLRRWLVGCHAFERFSIIAVCVIVGLFCIPSSKRSVYLLPAYPFIAFLVATALQRCEELQRGCDRGAGKVAGFLVSVCRCLSSPWLWGSVWVVGVAVFQVMRDLSIQHYFLGAWGRAYSNPWTVSVVAVLLFAATRPSLRRCTQELLQDRYCALGFWIVVVVGCVNWLVVDPFVILLSPRDWMKSYRVGVTLEGDHSNLYSYGTAQYAISFYRKQRISLMDKDVPGGSLVFVEPKDEARMREEFPREYSLVMDNQEYLFPRQKGLLLKEVRVYRVD